MNVRDGLNILGHESKSYWRFFLICSFVAVLFFSISYSLSKVVDYLPEIFKSQLTSEFRNDQQIKFIHAHVEDEKSLIELGLKNIILSLDNVSVLYKNLRFTSDQKDFEQPTSIQFVSLSKESYDALKDSGGEMIRGEGLFQPTLVSGDSDMTPIWIREDYAEVTGIDIGDQINLYDAKSDTKAICEVKGIYIYAQVDTEYLPAYPQVFLPLSQGSQFLNNGNVSNECSGTATFNDIFDYLYYSSALKEMGILTFGTEAGDLINSVIHVSYFLSAFIIILNIVGFALLLSFIFMHISVRTRFIGIMIALGAQNRDILLCIALVLESILIISVALSILVGERLFKGINSIINVYIVIDQDTNGLINWSYMGLIFLGLNVLLLLSLFLIWKKIVEINPIKIIMESAS